MEDMVKAALDAVGRSKQVRLSRHRQFPEDRDTQLEEQLRALSEAMCPLLPLLRRGSMRRRRLDPVCQASDAIQAERRRLRNMRGRRTGGKSPAPRVPRVPYNQARGTIRQAKGEEHRLRAELDEVRERLGSSRTWAAAKERQEAGRRVAEEIDPIRQRLMRTEARHWAWLEEALAMDEADDPGEVDEDRSVALMEDSAGVRMNLTELSSRARRWARRSIPQRNRRKSTRHRIHGWHREAVRWALQEFADLNGRPPTARELKEHDWLPSYGTVHALFDGLNGVWTDEQASR